MKKHHQYIAVDIGCIECGEDSALIGVFPTQTAAEAAIRAYLDPTVKWGKQGRRGQHDEQIFEWKG